MKPAVLMLASASPRRRELLAQIGVPHVVVPQDIDETRHEGEPALDYVCRMADAKADAALAVPGLAEAAVVLASDTAVVIGETVLGKPQYRQEAVAMLQRLSRRTHTVLTAVTVASVSRRKQKISESAVTFRAVSTGEAERYWQTGEPAGKAGGYAIQGLGAVFVESLSGSYSGVMGLPLFETAQLLQVFAVPCWQPIEED